LFGRARHAGVPAATLATREHAGKTAAPIRDSPMMCIYPGQVTSHPNWQRPDDLGGPASASLVDPEDDLPSSNYAGDFETTAIPGYKSGPQPGFGLISDPEPLPYVQSGDGQSMSTYAQPADITPGYDDPARADHRRGTQDLGLLVLRCAVGALLIGHGLQKAFGLWGGPGLGGFGDSLTAAGYRYADILTYIATGAQILAGVLLILGLFTPLAAAGALAYLVNGLLVDATVAHDEARLSDFLTDGHEYKLVLIAAVVAIILVGPGRYGLDAGRGWARRPFVGSFAALLLGIGGGIAVWVFLNGGNPLA
jgi:putative oxidoreductase